MTPRSTGSREVPKFTQQSELLTAGCILFHHAKCSLSPELLPHVTWDCQNPTLSQELAQLPCHSTCCFLTRPWSPNPSCYNSSRNNSSGLPLPTLGQPESFHWLFNHYWILAMSLQAILLSFYRSLREVKKPVQCHTAHPNQFIWLWVQALRPIPAFLLIPAWSLMLYSLFQNTVKDLSPSFAWQEFSGGEEGYW